MLYHYAMTAVDLRSPLLTQHCVKPPDVKGGCVFAALRLWECPFFLHAERWAAVNKAQSVLRPATLSSRSTAQGFLSTLFGRKTECQHFHSRHKWSLSLPTNLIERYVTALEQDDSESAEKKGSRWVIGHHHVYFKQRWTVCGDVKLRWKVV